MLSPDLHFHVWIRAGRIFTMRMKRFNDRTVAHRWAAKQRDSSRDRLVLACVECPKSSKSKRRNIRWEHVAEAVGVPYLTLARAILAERGNGDDVFV